MTFNCLMSNRKIHLCTRVVLRYIGTLRFPTYTLFSQSNLALKLVEQIYCMTSLWSCHQNNTVTRVSECKLKFLLFVIMILNNFQCFVRKLFKSLFLEFWKNHIRLHPCMRSVTMTVFFFISIMTLVFTKT